MISKLSQARNFHRLRTDDGVTLLELVTAMALTIMVFTLLIPACAAVSYTISSTNSSSNGNSQARIALSEFTSEIGSANSDNICFPSGSQLAVSDSCPANPNGTTYGNTIRVLTDAFGACTWDQWTVTTAGELVKQTWPITWTSAQATPLTIPVAGPVENSGTTQPLFTYDTTNLLVHIQIALIGSTSTSVGQASTSQAGSQYVFLQTSIGVLDTTATSGTC